MVIRYLRERRQPRDRFLSLLEFFPATRRWASRAMTAFLSALIGACLVTLLVLPLTRGAALGITHSTSYLRVLSTRDARRMQVSSLERDSIFQPIGLHQSLIFHTA